VRVKIDHDFVDSGIPANVHPDLEHRYATDGNQTLGNFVSNWSKSRTLARGQQKGLHQFTIIMFECLGGLARSVSLLKQEA
jgi:hypothetical protein